MPRLVVPARPPDLGLLAGTATTLRFVEDSGPRGVLDATVNDASVVPMLVHANAGFTVMLTHDALAALTGERVAKESEFGLGADLRVSELGRGRTTLGSLTVAGHRMADVPCEVFALPTMHWAGMLGVGWLAAARPVVDFGGRRLLVPDDAARPAVSDALEAAGGLTVPLRRDAVSGRYLASLSTGERTPTATFVVSTVARTILDLGYVRSLGLDVGDPVGVDHGPGGAVVPQYEPAGAVAVHADGRLLAVTTVEVHDIYAYSGSPRVTGPHAVAGYLGADVLLATGAVLDFGEGQPGSSPMTSATMR